MLKFTFNLNNLFIISIVNDPRGHVKQTIQIEQIVDDKTTRYAARNKTQLTGKNRVPQEHNRIYFGIF